MIKKYRAAVVYGRGDVRLTEVPFDPLEPDEVLIEVHKANICPTDLRGFRGAKPVRSPERVGHEFAGYVVEVGGNVHRVKIGDRVTCLSWTPCYRCGKCTRGKYSACERRTMNMGAFAEYIAVKESAVYKIPDHLPFEVAACAEPLASVLKANTEVTPVQLCDTVVVYGLGPMGQLHLQAARLLGAALVIGIDLLPSRLDIALTCGADHVVHAGQEDPVEAVRRLTGGEGADIVMVAVGGAAEAPCTENAVRMAAFGGKINVFTGTYPERSVTVDPNLIHYQELTVTGTRSYNIRTFEMALNLLASGRVNVAPIRYPEITLEEIQKGFELHGTQHAMKVAVNIR
ncbi:MAG: alcohol dehydrogenase catalytic domain-containing protein [Alicyclobacillus macrosporangiidus]|uniref:zinc-dependent alcohol dehydrogenase n=1 Tax=Alicyclobacillus macrosporangiidus TaxID=392015 RepID=UPI0026F16C9A|nr:alcohol dehydrogenase catalytic domain-containing protein [Alicyclobacillus macrosporangiidus]MCL6597601.1 alcohol dehydrogenase catalytic domain-containing protein [Alicyclobacillus macrosporangiidus]